ncbi:MAG TPA: hypothetical protein PLF81_06040 [Candidatus Anammoximicrobium sp.]|nr:hypothetical protein [Candidatus Anammoximicrobium sp.]
MRITSFPVFLSQTTVREGRRCSKDCYADGHEKDWLLVTTNPHATASGVRDDYALRTDVEEMHRQVNCFWDLTRWSTPS